MSSASPSGADSAGEADVSTYRPRRSTIFLYDFMIAGQRYHGSTGCKTKRDADKKEAQLRAMIALDTGQRKKPPITLDTAAALYEDRLRENGRWSATADYMIAGIVKALGGDRLLSDIGQDELRDHFSARAAKVSASSVNREIDVCRPIWRHVMRTHDIGEMPDWGRFRYAVPQNDPRELYHDEEKRLFPEIRADLADFCQFALQAGWRMGEVIGLRWSDCNMGAAVAMTRIKGGDMVKRPLTQAMVILIANQPKTGPFVFTYVCQKNHRKRRAGERYPMTKTVLRGQWAAAKKAAAIEGLRFHDLRHTRGTRILRATGNLAAAKEALKHRHIRTTLRYAHAADDDVRKALDASESRPIPEVDGNEKLTSRKNSGN